MHVHEFIHIHAHLGNHCEVFLGRKKLVAGFSANKENSSLTVWFRDSKENAEMLTTVYSHGNY